MVESTNKTLIQVLKKIIAENQRNWHKRLIDALWASKITPMGSTRESPYTLVYRKEAYNQYNQLVHLEEHRAQSFTTMNERQ